MSQSRVLSPRVQKIISAASRYFISGQKRDLRTRLAIVVNTLDRHNFKNDFKQTPIFDNICQRILQDPMAISKLQKLRPSDADSHRKITKSLLNDLIYYFYESDEYKRISQNSNGEDARGNLESLHQSAVMGSRTYLTSFRNYPKDANAKDAKDIWQEDSHFALIKDPLFPSYNATHIEGTRYFLGAGPHSKKEFEKFLDNLISNDIQQVIASGDFKTIGKAGGDFIPYFIEDGQYGPYKVTVKQISVDSPIPLPQGGPLPQLNMLTNAQFIKSTLNIQKDGKDITIMTTVFNCEDNKPLELSSDYAKKELAELYLSTLPKIIHCGAGVGRSGCILFAFVVADKMDEIFVQGRDDLAVENLLRIYEMIYKNGRPGAIWVEEQFTQGALFGVMLNDYAKNIKKLYGSKSKNHSHFFSSDSSESPELTQSTPILLPHRAHVAIHLKSS